MSDPSQIVSILSTTEQSLGGSILSYALALAGVGTIVMAVLEGIKAIVPIRYYFHRGQAKGWIDDHSTSWAEFIALTTGGYQSERALFDQPVEKLMAEVQAAANMAMDFPDRYPNFYAFLTRQPDPGHVEDSQRWVAHVAKAKSLQADAAPTQDDREAAKARARLQNLMLRQLDAFQNETGYRWARSNQAVATVVGAAVILYLLLPAAESLAIPLEGVFFIALVGGMTAPVAKDVASGLSSFRK
jgi:hypothetical protein